MRTIVAALAVLIVCLGLSGAGQVASAAPSDREMAGAASPQHPPAPGPAHRAPMNGNSPSQPASKAFGWTRLTESGRPEYLVVGRSEDVDRAAQVIRSELGKVLRREELSALGLSLIAADLDDDVPAGIVRRRLVQEGIRVAFDRNTVLAPAGGRVYAPALVGAPDRLSCRLPRSVRIGLIDGPVDARAPGVSAVPITSRKMLDDTEEAADPDHATGLVSLIAAPQGAGDVSGLAVGADIFSAVAFSRDQDRTGMRLDHFAKALDWLIGESVDIVNMSVAGPKNRVLTLLLAMADRNGAILVAAVGNEGRGVVAFPAADPNVIAVTAIDARLRLYRSANTGSEIDFAAPGVDLLVMNGDGPGYRSGTSYATAIASAVIAHEISAGQRGRDRVVAALKAKARDLGQPGRDNGFGWGLLQLSDC